MRVLACLAFLAASAAAAQAQTPAAKPTDVNIYPSLNPQGGLYDLNVAGTQNGPPGTVALTTAAPSAKDSFAEMVANTHGYVSAGVSSHSGHSFEGGLSIPLVPGKVELEVAAASGQDGGYKFANIPGKTPTTTYDAYSVGLALHPTEDISAYIGVSSVRLHSSGLGLYPYGPAGPLGFPAY